RLRTTPEIDLVVVNSFRFSDEVLAECEALKALPSVREKSIPLILLYDPRTAGETPEFTFHARGIDRVIHKPFKMADLGAVIADLHPDMPNAAREMPDSGRVRKIPLAGSLGEITFGELLTICIHQKLTGTVTVAQGEAFKKIHFEAGQISSISSSFIEAEALGTLLTEKGKITPQLNKLSLKKMKERQCRQGEMLIEMGCITPHELYEGLLYQAKVKLVSLFTWESADYEIEKGGTSQPTDFPLLDLDLILILKEGLQTYTLKRLQRYFAKHYQKRLRLLSSPRIPLEKYPLTRPEKILLSYVNGEHTVSELLTLSEIDLEKTLRLILLLIVVGRVAFEDRAYTHIVLAEEKPPKEVSLASRRQSSRADREAAPLRSWKGTLRRTPYPHLLVHLHFTKQTGALRLFPSEGSERGLPGGGTEEWTIYFQNGMPVKVVFPYIPELTLLNLLVKQGKIDEATADLVREQIEHFTNYQVGEMLIAMGYITYTDLSNLLTYQGEQKMLRVFRWPDAAFEFQAYQTLPDHAIEVECDLLNVVARGIRTYWNAERIERVLSPYLDHPLRKRGLAPRVIAKVLPDPSHLPIFHAFNRATTFTEVLQSAHTSHEVTLQILYTLLLFDGIRLKGKEAFYHLQEIETPLEGGEIAWEEAGGPESTAVESGSGREGPPVAEEAKRELPLVVDPDALVGLTETLEEAEVEATDTSSHIALPNEEEDIRIIQAELK
ncbi:MAG: DUF4388 domain-containing protein, partial [Deltaproteobacteria bacterium]